MTCGERVVIHRLVQEDYAEIATALATRPRALKAAKECVRRAKVRQGERA